MANNDEWEEISSQSGSSETNDFDSNPILIGKYIHMQENVGPNKSRIYDIEVAGADEPIGVWGSTVLDGKFDEVAIGSIVRIEYLGKVQGKTSKYKDWKLSVKKAEAAKPADDGLGEIE